MKNIEHYTNYIQTEMLGETAPGISHDYLIDLRFMC